MTDKTPLTALDALRAVVAAFDTDGIRAHGFGLIALSNARDYLEQHPEDNLPFEVQLANYHQAVWKAAEGDVEGERVAYDDAGKDIAKELILQHQAARKQIEKHNFRAHLDECADKAAQMPGYAQECLKPVTNSGISKPRAAYYYIRERGEGEDWRATSEQAYLNAREDATMDTTTLWDMYQSEKDNRERFQALLNTPEVEDFLQGVKVEAPHQVERWTATHDDGKYASDWFWLVGFLAGKILHNLAIGEIDKARHHCITTAAALYNWHAAITGKSSAMRPGIANPDTCQCQPGTDRTITQGGHVPACTACHKRLK